MISLHKAAGIMHITIIRNCWEEATLLRALSSPLSLSWYNVPNVIHQMALVRLSKASDAAINARVQGQLSREGWPGKSAVCLCTADVPPSSVCFSVSVWIGGLFHLKSLTRSLCLPPWDMNILMCYIAKCPPPTRCARA